MSDTWGPLDRLVGEATALAGAWGARARGSTTIGQERAILRLFGVSGLDGNGQSSTSSRPAGRSADQAAARTRGASSSWWSAYWK